METGTQYTSAAVVTDSMTARAAGSGDLPVLATPMMLALMENAAMLCVAPHLPEGSTTVGSSIQSSHLRPTPIGAQVQATATLTAVEGRKLTFRIEASDARGIIGQGTHERFVVERERFLSKLK